MQPRLRHHAPDPDPGPDPNQVQAYILEPSREPVDYGNGAIENLTITWRYTDNPKVIINAPINDVIFLDPDEDKDHNGIRQKILNRCNIDPLILKHQKIFKLFVTDYPNRKFCINTKPNLDIYRGYHYEENTKILADYIKDTGCNLSYEHVFTHPVYSDERDRLNNVGIYIRPAKKLLEYNPILARRQHDIRHSKKKKAIPYGITLGHLRSVEDELQRILRYNMDLTITYRSGWDSSRRKFGISESILILIDFYNMFFQKNSYRDFNSYKELITNWKDTSKQKRELYPKKFIQWMISEEKIKLKPPKTRQYYPIKKPKLSIFKISKLKWTKKDSK